MSLSSGFLLSGPTGLVPETHGLGSRVGTRSPPPLCQFARAENPSGLTLSERELQQPCSQEDSKTCDPQHSHIRSSGQSHQSPRGRPHPYQAGTWTLILVFKSLTQRTTTEFLQLPALPSQPVCKGGRDNAWVPPASQPEPGSRLVPEPGIQPTGKRAPKVVWTVVEGRVHRNPPIRQNNRVPPHILAVCLKIL